ncbi:MAG TPA: hypothetical protein VHE09_08230 [Rhizomicrobium sp.]|nr:hypothetical protein [Rhizomicrobium sp.]
MAQGSKASTVAKTQEDEIAELISYLALTNRVSSHLETAISEVDANISLTDWLLLYTVSSEGPLPATKIAYKIGVTRQRVYQQTSTLITAGFLLREEVGDSKFKTIGIAPGGTVLLKRIERALRDMLSQKSGNLPTGPIHTACNGTKRLVRSLPSQSSSAASSA